MSTATYVGMHGCVERSNVVECALPVCVLCQPVPPSMHPAFGRLLVEVVFIFQHFVFFLSTNPIPTSIERM